ncbi:complement factor B-like [Spea bombifrons]|uniref:complement factor B-like n=1 Tax=Spea bombifrons TaxID=233779 RepID=UPI002349E1DD|nr:complement factor B-like [Spea bombifrons]
MLCLILLSVLAVSTAAPASKCNLSKVGISGGNYTVDERAGNVHYVCPKGKYPYPAPKRDCQRNGQWTKEKIKAVCQDIRCPSPMMFENGEYYPRKAAYHIGDVLSFECWGGFEMKGPENRTCQENGKWSGKTTVCENFGGYCPNPGIPIGTTKVGSSYGIEDKVIYECKNGLEMFGSKVRECQENKRWSGAEPSCRDWYVFDTPEEVAEMFSSTLSANIEVADPDKIKQSDVDRKVIIKRGDPMNIFIILDASKSIGQKNFTVAKDSSIIFIDKISSYDIEPRYAVISYASLAIPIVRLSEKESLDASAVSERLEEFKYSSHEDKRGTNTRAALALVNEMLVAQELKDNQNFLKTRNVILLMTDGKYNMGGDPRVEMKKIRELLDIGKRENPREDYLDVYVFGLGSDLVLSELNELASKKTNEEHTFVMENADTMKQAFEKMIDETDAMDMCGLNKADSADENEKFPWIAKITIVRAGTREVCKGSILSEYFILTAAHCFHFDEDVENIKVEIGDSKDLLIVQEFYRHPLYKPEGKKDKNVPKSFDYDVALLKLKRKIRYSSQVRPICIPCTKSSAWALRKKDPETKCVDHEKLLFSEELVKALFIAQEDTNPMEQKDVRIKMGKKREGCLSASAKITEFENVADIRDAVTDQFLCTGGTEPVVDPPTCKGDSGGPLIINYKNRYIQVGIISWGTVNHCDKSTRRKTPVPENSRDFHVSLFYALPWIKEIAKDELVYLPD